MSARQAYYLLKFELVFQFMKNSTGRLIGVSLGACSLFFVAPMLLEVCVSYQQQWKAQQHERKLQRQKQYRQRLHSLVGVWELDSKHYTQFSPTWTKEDGEYPHFDRKPEEDQKSRDIRSKAFNSIPFRRLIIFSDGYYTLDDPMAPHWNEVQKRWTLSKPKPTKLSALYAGWKYKITGESRAGFQVQVDSLTPKDQVPPEFYYLQSFTQNWCPSDDDADSLTVNGNRSYHRLFLPVGKAPRLPRFPAPTKIQTFSR